MHFFISGSNCKCNATVKRRQGNFWNFFKPERVPRISERNGCVSERTIENRKALGNPVIGKVNPLQFPPIFS